MMLSGKIWPVTGNASATHKNISKLAGLLLICLSAVLPLCGCSESSAANRTPEQAAEACLNDFCKAVRAEDWPAAIRSLDLATANPMLLNVWNLEGYAKAEKLLSAGDKNLKKALEIMSGFPDGGEDFAEIRENLASIPAATRKKLPGQLAEICRSLYEGDTFPLAFTVLTLSEERKLLEAADDIVRFQLSVNHAFWEAVFRKNGTEWRLSSLQPMSVAERDELSEVELAYAKAMAKKKYDADSPEQALLDSLRAGANLDFEKAQAFLSDDYTGIEAYTNNKQNTKAAVAAQGRGLKSGSLHVFYAWEIEHAEKGVDRKAVSAYLKSFAGKKIEKFFMEMYRQKVKMDATTSMQTMSVVPNSRKVEGDSASLDVTVCDQTLGRKQIHFELVRRDGKWLIRKEVQTLLPPATDAEKKSMAKSLKLMGVKFEDEDENEFAGIYGDIGKAPFTRKGEREKRRKALWELLKQEDPDVSYDAVCMLYEQDYLYSDEVKKLKFNDVSRLDRVAAQVRDFYFVDDPAAELPNAQQFVDAEPFGTLSRLIVGKAVLGRFVWGRYQKRRAQYLEQAFATWVDKAKITEDSAMLFCELWSDYSLPVRNYDLRAKIDRLAKNGAPEWMTEYLLGDLSINLAWESRGSGTALTVTEEGWKGFKDYLKDADRYLDHSIQLNPQNYLAYLKKITTAMGHGTHKQEMDNFKKGIALIPDSTGHLSYLLQCLMPRWGGSRREMKQLLLEGMKQDETKTDVAHASFNHISRCMFYDEGVPLTFRSFYMDPVVQDCGERLFAQTLKKCPDDVYFQNVVRYEQALFYLNTVRYREALEAFDKITFKGKELEKFLYDNSVQKYQSNYPLSPVFEDPKAAFELRRSAVAPILQRIELNFLNEEISPAVARRQLLALADSEEAKADSLIRNSLLNLAAMWGEPDEPAVNWKLEANHSGPAWACACYNMSGDRLKFLFDHGYDVDAEPHFFLRARYYAGYHPSTALEKDKSAACRKVINAEAKKRWKYITGEGDDPEHEIAVISNPLSIDPLIAEAKKPDNKKLLVIEYTSRHKFFFNLKGDSLTMESFYGPFPAAVTVNGQPWSDPSKPFRIPFVPDYSHGFAMMISGVAKYETQAVCDGKDCAELLIVPGQEEYWTTVNTVVLMFDPDPARVSAMEEASKTSLTLLPVANAVSVKTVNNVPFDPANAKPLEEGKKAIVLEGVFDGEGLFIFRGNRGIYRHTAFDMPEKVTVNGKPWNDLKKPFELDFIPDYSKTNVSEMNGRNDIRLDYFRNRMELYISDADPSRDDYRVSVFFDAVKTDLDQADSEWIRQEEDGAKSPDARKTVNDVPFDPAKAKPLEDGKKAVVLEGVFDGAGTFTFSGNRIAYRHSTYDPPEKVMVNGRTWENLNNPFELDFTPDYATTNVAELNGRNVIGIKYSQDKMELEINDTEISRDNYRVSVFFGKVK